MVTEKEEKIKRIGKHIKPEHISTFLEACGYVDAPNVLAVKLPDRVSDGSMSDKYEEFFKKVALCYGVVFGEDISTDDVSWNGDKWSEGVNEILKWFAGTFNMGGCDDNSWY